MTRTYLVASLLMVTFCHIASAQVYTWDYLMSDESINDGHYPDILNPQRFMCTLDLNHDDVNDLLLSNSVSLGGTGGIPYAIYLGIGGDKYIRVCAFLTHHIAIERRPGKTRLWWYTHSSASSGALWHIWFEGDFRYHLGEPMDVYPGDGGTAIGNAMLDAIFTEESELKLREVERPASSHEG